MSACLSTTFGLLPKPVDLWNPLFPMSKFISSIRPFYFCAVNFNQQNRSGFYAVWSMPEWYSGYVHIELNMYLNVRPRAFIVHVIRPVKSTSSARLVYLWILHVTLLHTHKVALDDQVCFLKLWMSGCQSHPFILYEAAHLPLLYLVVWLLWYEPVVTFPLHSLKKLLY